MANLPGPKFAVSVSPRALDEIEETRLYIAIDSPANADLVLARIERVIDGLECLPRRYPVAPEAERYRRELRHVVVSSFRVMYEVRELEVRVHFVRHGSRQPPEDLVWE